MGQGSTTLAGAGAEPQDNPPRQQPVKDSSTNESGAGARETCREPETVASIQQKRERLRRSLFLLCPVSGVMYTEFEHRNHERVTPVNPLGVLGKAVRLVQSVTIPAPVDIIVLLRVFASPLDGLDFPRNQSTDDFLTFSHDFSPPFDTTDRPRLRTSAAPAWANWMLPRLLRSGYAALRNCGGIAAAMAYGGDTTPPCTPPRYAVGECSAGSSRRYCVPPRLRALRHITCRYTRPGHGRALRRITLGYVQ